MQIEYARSMGFCAGVRRAVLLLEEALAADSDGPISSYGPLIHNPRLVESFRARGVRVVDSPDKVETGERVVIRAHGVPADVRRGLETRGARIIDATCVKVQRNMAAARRAEAEGRTVVLAGDAGHGEMLAVAGSLRRPESVLIVDSAGGAEGIDIGTAATLIAQTTFDSALFGQIAEILAARVADLRVEESICPATRTRQEAVAELAERVDALVVIGGADSANTRRLFSIAAASGKPAWRIDGPEELPQEIVGFGRVGISAGASTPDAAIAAVAEKLKEMREGEG